MSPQTPSPCSDSDAELPKYLQQEEIAEKYRDLVLSMPREPGWVATHLHQYQGFWHTTRQVQGVLSCQNHFQANDTDIILVTTPKSGTTWLKAIMFCLLNRSPNNFPLNDPQNPHPLLSTNPHVLVPFLELDLFIDRRRPDLSTADPSRPRLFSTHIPAVSLPDSVRAARCKLVYLSRNPKDTFVSLWHFANKLRLAETALSIAEALDKFCRGVSLYGPFWEHCLGYWKMSHENPDKVLFLRFDDMKKEPVFHVKKLAEFIGCPLSEEEEAKGVVNDVLELCSFEKLSGLEVNKSGKLPAGEANKAFFRRGEVGDWVNYLTPDMAANLDAVIEDKLSGSGLNF